MLALFLPALSGSLAVAGTSLKQSSRRADPLHWQLRLFLASPPCLAPSLSCRSGWGGGRKRMWSSGSCAPSKLWG